MVELSTSRWLNGPSNEKTPALAGVFPVDVTIIRAEVIVLIVATNEAIMGVGVPSILHGPVAESLVFIPLLADNDSFASVVFETWVASRITHLSDSLPGGVQAVFYHGHHLPGYDSINSGKINMWW